MTPRAACAALALALATTACDRKPPRPQAGPDVAAPRPGPFLKGQLHAHTSGSGDGHTTPRDVVRWYADRGYDFVVFTDHNVVTAPVVHGTTLGLPGVELTHNLETCTPPPATGEHCLLHVNALLVADDVAGPVDVGSPGPARDAVYRASIDWAVAHGAIAQLNHPNFHHAVDAPLLEALVRGGGLPLFELANQAWDSGNAGDAVRPSTEALWDAVLARGLIVYGVATDDAHHFDDAAAATARGERPFVGDLGFVMVRATREPAAIRDALRRGDFYASTGLLLDDAALVDGTLAVRIAASAAAPTEITFIGTGGRELRRVAGPVATFALADAPPGTLRAVARDARGRTAWVQPVRTR